ncbi:MAG TPA: ATP-binding protein [Comamonadaceae bacterium]|nr:MAG: histidine kinase [Burkholderiales bacterium RIFCSPHIGHO2_12_63_9]OGB45963.1 MAG: histidine kinase [Burkholderiales bacterium RIFCSPLOWO2_12_FULL_65_40]HCE30022.1 ATP-binding protein [Comamonadaceae bacterium]
MTLSGLRKSLRIRLLAGTLFWIAASIALAGWGLSNMFRQHVASQFHAELRTHLDQLTAHIILDAQGRPVLTQPMSDPRLGRPYSGYYWQIDQVETSGGAAEAPTQGQLRSRSLWDHVLQVPPDAPKDGEIHQHRVMGPENKMLSMVERSVFLNDTSGEKTGKLRLIAAASESFMEEPVARLNSTLWLALGVLGAGMVLAALVQVVVGLAPLRSLRTALARVRNGESQRLEGDFPGEITPLIDEFNTVLGHNAEVVQRARTHAGNLAHALKTPLSVLANAAHASGMNPETAKLARLVNEQVSVARKHVDYHLGRAQTAATERVPGSRTPLQPILEGLVRVMHRIHADRELQFHVDSIPASLDFRGEAQDLQEMLGNLLDNACKWASRTISVSVRIAPGTFTILIDDDGPGLTREQRASVVQRGVRADEKTPGSGLGLSIVDDLARLYGGGVELDDSPLGGLRAALTLPAHTRT